MTDLQDSKRSLEPTVAELFAGVGGFRLGLEASGWKVSYSNQWEPSTKKQHASNVYVHRFGASGHSNEDISKVARLPLDPALMVGGFPCQDYSVAKSKSSATGLEGKKGVLWWEIERLVALHEPRFLFLENVDRLLKSPSQNGREAQLGEDGKMGSVQDGQRAGRQIGERAGCPRGEGEGRQNINLQFSSFNKILVSSYM